MADAFIHLSSADRQEVLEVAASASARPSHLLEKDIWVVWALSTLFGAPYGDSLVFKGGTSLSKAYGAIRRFSEDVDLTYDIRALIPHLVAEHVDALPPNRSQEKKWTKEVRHRLPAWIAERVLPDLDRAIQNDGIDASIRHEGDKVFVDYPAVATGSGYVSPLVMLEFGARSTGEPCEVHELKCDAAKYVLGIVFPQAVSRVMRIERTFWEKATAVHVFCAGADFRTERFARHWYDLARLDEAGYADRAIGEREIAEAVANHKSLFFREKGADGNLIDYRAAVSGALRLVPTEKQRDELAADYARMVDDGLLIDDAESFDSLLKRCESIEQRANRQNQD